MSLAHGWSRSFSGIVQSSFLRGYLITPVAVGTRVDYYGGEVVMGWGVALWSLATFLTPWAADTSLWALLATRAMLGIAEGVALPCVNNMIASLKGGKAKMLKKLYKPFLLDGSRRQNESGLLGLQWLDFNFGNAIGLTQSPILLSKGCIFGPFVIFGLSGFLWVLNDCTMWKSLLPVSRFSSTEDKHHHLLIYHVDLKHASWFSAVPWRVMGFMGYFGGIILKTAGTLAAIVGTVGAGFFVELRMYSGYLCNSLSLKYPELLFQEHWGFQPTKCKIFRGMVRGSFACITAPPSQFAYSPKNVILHLSSAGLFIMMP
ncbi:probable anion transporter 4, chloroplastic [Populus alba]|uniref:probable anion transporter 4, chloroplastic n=1 Tax=Populus alba TaxID=43335 RepID=UPI001589161F|nr:probable anion transporter 4, chloroplastic [Populus alba]